MPSSHTYPLSISSSACHTLILTSLNRFLFYLTKRDAASSASYSSLDLSQESGRSSTSGSNIALGAACRYIFASNTCLRTSLRDRLSSAVVTICGQNGVSNKSEFCLSLYYAFATAQIFDSMCFRCPENQILLCELNAHSEPSARNGVSASCLHSLILVWHTTWSLALPHLLSNDHYNYATAAHAPQSAPPSILRAFDELYFPPAIPTTKAGGTTSIDCSDIYICTLKCLVSLSHKSAEASRALLSCKALSAPASVVHQALHNLNVLFHLRHGDRMAKLKSFDDRYVAHTSVHVHVHQVRAR